MLNKADVTKHVEILNANFANEIARAERIIAEMQAGRSKNHGAHNLAAAAQAMAVLAGQIEALEMVERSVSL
jgi:hypothetical protein